MDLNDLLLRLARVLGNEGQVGPHLLPAVEDGDLDHLAGRDPDLIQLAQQAPQFLHQGCAEDDLRVIVDHQRAVGGHCLYDAGDLAVLKGDVIGADLGVDGLADLIAEFHAHRGIARQQESDVSHGWLLSERPGGLGSRSAGPFGFHFTGRAA